MVELIATAVALFAGLMVTRVFKLFKLNFPDVTAFLIAGLLVGPFVLGRLGIPGLGFASLEEVEGLEIINKVALGFIAFSIGAEFRLSNLKQNGKAATVIGIAQAVVTALLVDAVLIGLHFILGEDKLPLSVCITLGAIAAATAPAATLMVVRQYKADGPLTKLLLPIVALDDAVGLVLFAISFGVAGALLNGGGISATTVCLEPFMEIFASLILGTAAGFVMAALEKLFFSNSNRLTMTISFVFLTIALSTYRFEIGGVNVGFSPLLVCMMQGTIFCNISEFSTDIFHRCDRWTAPLYCAFFVLSGAELDLGVFAKGTVVMVGIIYIVLRCLGKYFGARLSSSYCKCDKKVRDYLGITLFPQAGVALGMSLTAKSLGESEGSMIRNIVLFGVLIYELVGPSMTKWALEKAGEIKPAGADKKDRHRFEEPKKV